MLKASLSKVNLVLPQKGFSTRAFSPFVAALIVLRRRGQLVGERRGQNGEDPPAHEAALKDGKTVIETRTEKVL